MIALVAVAAMAAAQAAQPAQSPAQTMEALQTMYEQSCQVRAYGSYDDLCNTLRKQINNAKREQSRAKSKPQAPPASANLEGKADAPPASGPAALAASN
jgi:hypothetical protein